MYACMYVCVQACMHVCMHVSVCMQVCTHLKPIDLLIYVCGTKYVRDIIAAQEQQLFPECTFLMLLVSVNHTM